MRRRVSASGSPVARWGGACTASARSSTSRTAAAGKLQLLASEDGLGPELFAAFCDTQLGDVIGVAGEAIAAVVAS